MITITIMILDDCDALHYRQEVLCRRCRAGEGEKKKKKVVSVFHGGRSVAPPCLCKDMKNSKMDKKLLAEWIITYFPLQAKYVHSYFRFTEIHFIHKQAVAVDKCFQITFKPELKKTQLFFIVFIVFARTFNTQIIYFHSLKICSSRCLNDWGFLHMSDVMHCLHVVFYSCEHVSTFGTYWPETRNISHSLIPLSMKMKLTFSLRGFFLYGFFGRRSCRRFCCTEKKNILKLSKKES